VTPRRAEAFADGVFAIAATLLILNVDAQVGDRATNLGHGLLHIWPSYLAYAVSFVSIGIMWINHHTVMDQIDRVDRRFLLATVGLLMCIAFVPFPTRLIAEHAQDGGARAAALAYGITLTVTALFFNLTWFYASRQRRLLRVDADAQVVSGITRTYLPGPWIYLTATLVALVSSTASIGLYAAITVFFVLESSLFGRSSAGAET
jgi:uncharacterized membrane protein